MFDGEGKMEFKNGIVYSGNWRRGSIFIQLY